MMQIVKFWTFQEGKERHFKLGQLNRERYADFLSDSYDPDEVYVRSTDVDRTLMSAESHLAGLYPPTNSQIWNPDLNWQPIPIHTIPKEQGQSTRHNLITHQRWFMTTLWLPIRSASCTGVWLPTVRWTLGRSRSISCCSQSSWST